MDSSNSTLLFILIAVVLGVVSYILIRYWSSLTSEWHQHFNGSVTAHNPALGLSSSDVEAFPTFIYQGPTKNCNGNHEISGNQGVGNANGMVNSKRHGVSVECSICLCDLRQGDVVRILPPCRHFFHVQCIDVWLYANPSCPICRASMQSGSVSLTESSMYPPLPHLHQCNNLEGTDAATMQTMTEEMTSSRGITGIVVEQEPEMARNMDKNTKRSTDSESIT
ncbi:RING-H2 finger protein ATL46 [Rhynchospora pubera]|uniref:RING-type E3 ubiquitin transferase n=1 Tax=Rhynchospora pubera TaxID=906938 RepID=A0AAV8ERR0_9POAL|nr:RING-H2 finger protein ATL46 [Rhynchospora pubera]